MSETPRPTRPEIGSWCLFDFANSSFTTNMVTVIFPVYLATEIAGGNPDAKLWFGAAISVSQWLVILSAPLVGAVADFCGAKKRLLLASTAVCVLMTALMGVLPGDAFLLLAAFAVANVAFSTGENLVAAFLPEISDSRNAGRISGIAWGIGYLGGMACLGLSYAIISSGVTLGLDDSTRLSFVATSLFFAVAATPTFLFLKERGRPDPARVSRKVLRAGFQRLGQTLHELRRHQPLFRFLGVFLVYSCGLTTVISFAAVYAQEQLRYTTGELVSLFLALQITSCLGALAFGALQDRVGARLAIESSLVLWLAAIGLAWLADDKTVFAAAAALCGLCIGGTQAASRALVSQLSPPGRSGEFFGFWGVAGKLAASVGPLSFGLFAMLTGSSRAALLLTGMFFLAGLAGMILLRLPDRQRPSRDPRF